jgi:ubiquinone/menaquinone biosynthesis C-methylase UbiE
MSLNDSMELLRALCDPTRVRLMCALEHEELTVAELQEVLDMPQSRVSTHLGRLKEAGLALDRIDGPHRYYRLADGSMPMTKKSAWQAIRQPLEGDAQLERDRQRREAVIAARSGGASWVDRVAGSLDRHYSPGRTWESLARGMVLASELGDVVDLGAGDGAIAELLAPAARSIVGIDLNERMVQAGQKRLKRAQLPHVRLVLGDMHAPPVPDRSCDFVLLQQSLQYAADPPRVFREAARMLRPSGRLLVVTLSAHEHQEVRSEYGHLHLGFRPQQLRSWARVAGMEVMQLLPAGRERRPPQFEALALLAKKPKNRNVR